jgi:hypothetical protein
MSTALPSASLTLGCVVSKLRTRTDTLRRDDSGISQIRPIRRARHQSLSDWLLSLLVPSSAHPVAFGRWCQAITLW